jgi:hypothetical protein
MHSSEMDCYRQRIVMITIRFNRRSMHSLTMLWEKCVMRNVGARAIGIAITHIPYSQSKRTRRFAK